MAFSDEAGGIISQEDFTPDKDPVIKTALIAKNREDLDGTLHPGPYTFSLTLPVKDFESKVDIRLGWAESAMRGGGWTWR